MRLSATSPAECSFCSDRDANLSVADYLERLSNTTMRLGLVDASFSLSYELLTPELQNLWSLLFVFPADFNASGAAAVWEMEKSLRKMPLAN